MFGFLCRYWPAYFKDRLERLRAASSPSVWRSPTGFRFGRYLKIQWQLKGMVSSRNAWGKRHPLPLAPATTEDTHDVGNRALQGNWWRRDHRTKRLTWRGWNRGQKLVIDKLHPDTEQMIMLITQTFVLGGNQTHDPRHSSQGHWPLDQSMSMIQVLVLK